MQAFAEQVSRQVSRSLNLYTYEMSFEPHLNLCMLHRLHRYVAHWLASP